MTEIYDALIVGAGPAGAFVAELLARQGARVALFDGRPAREPKACGGGVTAKALRAYPFILDAAGRTIDEVEMHAPTGERIKLKLDEPFAIFSRRALDEHLRERARRAGAKVFSERVGLKNETSEDELWRVKSENEEWRGKILVAADGANSAIARKLAGALPPTEMEVAFGYRTPLPSTKDAPTVIAFLPGYAGYAWAFPRLDHISFGIATAQSSFNHKALDEMLWKFMTNYYQERRESDLMSESVLIKESNESWFDERQSEGADENVLRRIAERYAARIPGLSPQVWDARQTAGKNWALLGDAAGFADPVTGEGIYYALRSAELFARAFAEDSISVFEKLWREDFGRELRRAGEMRAKFYGSFFGAPFTARMIQLAGASEGMRKTLCELIAGEQGYINLKRKLLLRAFTPFQA